LKTKSAFSGVNPVYRYLLFISRELFISLKAIGFGQFIPEVYSMTGRASRKLTKKKYPVNPGDPV
jgi:hypothetical protein